MAILLKYMMNSNNNIRQDAWTAFLIASERVQKGTYSLDLVRHARVFSTAPPERYDRLICIIGAASKIGNAGAVRRVGQKLYYWADENGYDLS